MFDHTSDSPDLLVIKVPLSKGKETIIDSIDADLVALKWQYYKGYAKRKSHRASPSPCCYRLHRLVLERKLDRPLQKGEVCDHINGDTLDNRRQNLRAVSHGENIRNQKKRCNNTSGYKGVSWHKRDHVWQANIFFDGNAIYLGSFNSAEEAHEAYKTAAIKYHGEFARFE